MALTREDFERRIGDVLCSQQGSVTADLTDNLVAFWEGERLAYILIVETPEGPRHEEFVMDESKWRAWHSWFEAWLEAPTYSVHSLPHRLS